MKMNKGGFTLVELMVVLAILGLLAGIGIPQYTKVLERAKIGSDIARVAQVQAAVNAFVAECGSAQNVVTAGTVAVPTKFLSAEATPVLLSSVIGGKSIITNQPIALSDFLDTGMDLGTVLTNMESSAAHPATGTVSFYINNAGKIFIGTSATAPVLK